MGSCGRKNSESRVRSSCTMLSTFCSALRKRCTVSCIRQLRYGRPARTSSTSALARDRGTVHDDRVDSKANLQLHAGESTSKRVRGACCTCRTILELRRRHPQSVSTTSCSFLREAAASQQRWLNAWPIGEMSREASLTVTVHDDVAAQLAVLEHDPIADLHPLRHDAVVQLDAVAVPPRTRSASADDQAMFN